MTTLPPCPQCNSPYSYPDRDLLMCPECAHQWSLDDEDLPESTTPVFRDAHGSVLVDGDSVTLIKDLKVKGSSQVLKVGTRVRNIRLSAGDHDIDCSIDGMGAMKLKSQFVRKA